MRRSCRLIVAFVAGLWAAPPALAAPYTLYFTYEVLSVHDYAASTHTYPGGSYSGWVTWDTAVAESTYDSGAGGSPLQAIAHSESGCIRLLSGSCTPGSDFGTGSPVVTAYAVSSPQGVLSPFVGWTGADFSERENWAWSGTYSYSVDRTQVQSITSCTDCGNFVEAGRRFSLYPGGFSASIFGGAYNDLDRAPDLSAVPALFPTNVFLDSYAFFMNCTPSCEALYAPGSYNVYGTLTSVYLVAGSHVPEPATMALVGLGLVGFAWTRRRRR